MSFISVVHLGTKAQRGESVRSFVEGNTEYESPEFGRGP